jgi:tRNA (guanine-N7-)-methyltransferase
MTAVRFASNRAISCAGLCWVKDTESTMEIAEGKYLSLSRFLLWRDLVVSSGQSTSERISIDWSQYFERGHQELHLELGFGNGEYMLRQCMAHPQINFVGLELHWGSIRRTLRRLEKAGISNVRLLQLDAELAFRYFLPAGCLSQIVSLFPCPWPKRDHTHHRLFSASFQRMMRHTLKPAGTARIVTDHPEFRDFILNESKESGMHWELSVIDARYQTKYERRWTSEGQQEFFQLDYVRDTQPSSLATGNYLPLQTRNTQTPPSLTELAREDSREGTILIERVQRRVHFKRHMQDSRTQLHMYLVVVVEEVVSQTFWLECRRGSTTAELGWVVGIAPGASVVPTAGVQEAIDRLASAGRGFA